MSLESSFQEIFRQCSNNDYSSYKTEQLNTLIQQIEETFQLLDREALFSKNEELDDIPTRNIPYLFLSYFLGKCLINIQDLESRIENLKSGKVSLVRFIDICQKYKQLHESEVGKIDDRKGKPMTGDEKRAFKIEKFKREKAAKKRIQEINRFLTIVKKDETVDHEEEQRELYLLTLQSYARDALDEIDMLEEELVMLQMRQQSIKENEGKTNSSTSNAPLPNHENRPGITVTKTFKAGGKLMMSRETVKATVFGPGIAPPTISLEEFADMEKAAAEDRTRKQAEAPKGPRRYNQLELDGDEDDLDLADDAIMEDRKWDDWKDENPRGWGNKMGKRF